MNKPAKNKPPKNAWRTDGWFVTDNTNFFHIRDLRALCKAGDEDLKIFLEFVCITVNCKTKKHQESLYKMLVRFLRDYMAAQQKLSAEHIGNIGKMVKFTQKACKH